MKIFSRRASSSAALLLMPALWLAGCATEPTPTELDFGNSVRQMKRAQTLNPSTIDNPSKAPVVGADGQYSEIVLDAYRTDAAKPEQVRNEIQINVGE